MDRLKRDDPRVRQAIEELVAQGKGLRQVVPILLRTMDIDPPFQTRNALKNWLDREKVHIEKPDKPVATLEQRVSDEKAAVIRRAEERDLRRKLGERARSEILADAISAAVLQLPQLEPVKYVSPQTGGFEEEHVVLILSDAHVGYWLTEEASGGLWSYDFDTFRSYVRLIVEKIRAIVPRHNYRIPVLHIHMLGDLIENQIMRPSQGYEIEFGLVKQVMAAAQTFAWMVRELLPMFEQIDVTVVPGNHGRMTQKYGELPAGESFDLVVGEFLKAYLKDEPRVKIDVIDAKRTVVDVLGWRVLLAHGDGIRGGFAGVPHYGRDRHNINIAGLYEDLTEGIDLIEMGHFHDPHEGTFRTWGRFFVNGAFTGASNYSIERLNRATQPAQWMYGVSRERPVTWQYLLSLAEMPPKRRRPA